MPLSVLSDDQIRGLLENLSPEDLESFRGALKASLHEYSVGTQSRPADDDSQPERQAVYSAIHGTKTLFMPSRGPPGLGVKVITLTTPAAVDEKSELPVVRPTGAITLFSPRGDPVALLHAGQLTAFRTALASLCLVLRREVIRTLTVFGAGLQAYWHVRLALMARGSTIRRVHIVSHQYSDSCRNLLEKFYGVPAEQKRLEGWADCKFGILTPGYVEYDRLLKEQVRAADVVFCCTPSTKELFPATHLTNPEGRRKGRLLVAIGSYTPQMAEIPVEVLRQATKRQRAGLHLHKHAAEGGVIVVDTLDGVMKEAGEIIAAGLLPDQLVELGELVMLQRIQLEDQQLRDLEDHNAEGDDAATAASPAAIEFDRLEVSSPAMSSVFSSAASGTTAASSRGSSPNRQNSNGLLSPTTPTGGGGGGARGFFSSHKRSSSSHSSAGSSERARKKKDKEDQMAVWLQTGNVVYKSVGMGLMDLSVGMHIVRFAKEKGVGTHVEDF